MEIHFYALNKTKNIWLQEDVYFLARASGR